MLNPVLKRELISIKYEDISISFLSENFGSRCRKTENGMEIISPKFNTTEEVELEAGEWINKNKEKTTVGIILWNKLFVENRFEEYIEGGFFNKVIDKKTFGKFISILLPYVRQKKIAIEPTWINFLKAYEFWGLNASFIFSPSYTMNIIKPIGSVMDKKDKLLKEAGDDADMVKMVQIEDQLTADAKDVLKNDIGYPIYASGARGSFDNDYKNISISLGAVKNLVTGDYMYVKNNYIDGLQKNDIVAMGNTLVASEHPKAVGTAVAGYITKKFYALFQDIVFDEPGTDCGSTSGLTVSLTADNADSFLYQNMIEKNKLVNLNDENKSVYVGKTVTFRSPMFCRNKNGKKCAACCGTRYYELEIENAGLTTGKISNDLLNKGMKARHSMKVSLFEADPNKLLLRKGV